MGIEFVFYLYNISILCYVIWYEIKREDLIILLYNMYGILYVLVKIFLGV